MYICLPPIRPYPIAPLLIAPTHVTNLKDQESLSHSRKRFGLHVIFSLDLEKNCLFYIDCSPHGIIYLIGLTQIGWFWNEPHEERRKVLAFSLSETLWTFLERIITIVLLGCYLIFLFTKRFETILVEITPTIVYGTKQAE